MTQSRVAQLLRAYGVRYPDERPAPGTMSIREAAKRVGVSRETLARLMRPVEIFEPRRIRKANLDKIADGLGIPRDLLERENMADWGYAQAAEGSDVAAVLAQLVNLSQADLATLQMEIGRMQHAWAQGRRPDPIETDHDEDEDEDADEDADEDEDGCDPEHDPDPARALPRPSGAAS